jgi:hypothetical protein
MIKKITTQALLSALFIMSVNPVTHAKEPEFKSELFKKGTLVYSDDSEGDLSKERWGGNRGDQPRSVRKLESSSFHAASR